MVRPSAKAVGIRLEFTTDIQHAAGKDNVVADCLSRSIVDAVNLGVDYGQMAADQASDPEVQALRRSDYRSAAAGALSASPVLRDGLKSFRPCAYDTSRFAPPPTFIQVWVRRALCLCAKISIVALCSLLTRDHFE
ncbi:hypothetical protein AAFF_G00013980 [Aldrovandia affinis]|uniref:Uncharacterized protein n=1 Tax=Aldrovandia affinis TaxID=143900 RepID=A0AAD7S6E7_9TELE|nr:hypothetical protein AAFF_G00013980 [Aldrovandia affinis]